MFTESILQTTKISPKFNLNNKIKIDRYTKTFEKER